MASKCESCGEGLSLTQRARGRDFCDSCTERRHADLARATAALEPALTAVVETGGEGSAAARLQEIEAAVLTNGGDPTPRKAQYYRSILDHALVDEQLTEEEEQRLDAVGQAFYPDDDTAQVEILRDYRTAFFVAMVNDDRLPVIDKASILLKKGEIAHLVEPAKLMKEVIHREFQGGSRGVSFRIMKGVSYRTGNSRGKMVETGRSLEVFDVGELTITSRRAVYTGPRKTVEVPYAKLIDMDVYEDAIQFHVSGRQTPVTVAVSSGSMIAAAVNTAVQRLS